jgi:hypothetical protein
VVIRSTSDSIAFITERQRAARGVQRVEFVMVFELPADADRGVIAMQLEDFGNESWPDSYHDVVYMLGSHDEDELQVSYAGVPPMDPQPYC